MKQKHTETPSAKGRVALKTKNSFLVILDDVDMASLVELADEHRTTKSDVVRRLIRRGAI